MIVNLAGELRDVFRNAKEVYIASALINWSGYQFVKSFLPAQCLANYIIGIDLPSHPDVLEDLMISELSGNVNAKIYNSRQTYHPKVYIIKTNDNILHAFVGSANTTMGGLCRNVEMTTRVNDQDQCIILLNWFNGLYQNCFSINREFLERYKAIFNRIRSRQASNYSDINNLVQGIRDQNQQPLIIPQYQFFNQSHFLAYEEDNWNDYSDDANSRRQMVKDRFKELHDLIYSQFENYGMEELHPHYHKPNIVSSHIYKEGFTKRTLDAMWLHYGYMRDEIPEGSKFITLPRIQIILRWDYIGIWLVVGKDNGSVQERDRLKTRLQNILSFRELFYQQMINLGGSYWIEISGDRRQVSDIESANMLNDFIQSDDYSDYFIIGRDYDISDTTLAEDNIPETVLLEFQRLYPLYVLVKHLNDD